MSIEAPAVLRVQDRCALFVATGGGAGYLPIAPGTWGSAEVSTALFLIFGLLLGPIAFSGPAVAAVLVGLAFVLGWAGIWAGDRVSLLLADDDPGLVVIDEVVGQLLTYSLLPLAGIEWSLLNFAAWLLAGFLVFRGLDIVKPGPINDLQEFHGGLGIMADDFLAGVVGGWIMFVAALLVNLSPFSGQ